MEWEAAGQSGKPAQGPQPPSKGKKTKRTLLLVVLAIVVIAIATGASRCSSGKSHSDSTWPTSGLATLVPAPDGSDLDVVTNSDDSFYARVSGYDDAKYGSYKDACKDKGFTVDAKNTTSGYEAYSEDGHHLKLSHYSDDLTIELKAPVELGSYTWPTSGPGSLLPKPASDKGKITSNSSSQFSIIVGDTTSDDFNAYADECSKAGFDSDFSKTDESYRAKNADGASVDVSLEGFGLMKIIVNAADDAESGKAKDADSAAEAPAASEPASDAQAASSTDSASFKETMDAYESFMNEYVDFMVKYENDGKPASMLADYSKLMVRYADFGKKVAAIDQDSLSDDDLAYYLEVMNRVNEKLAFIS